LDKRTIVVASNFVTPIFITSPAYSTEFA
jgi:hypothetical protein